MGPPLCTNSVPKSRALLGGQSQARAEAHRSGLVTDVGEVVGHAVTTLDTHEGEIEENTTSPKSITTTAVAADSTQGNDARRDDASSVTVGSTRRSTGAIKR